MKQKRRVWIVLCVLLIVLFLYMNSALRDGDTLSFQIFKKFLTVHDNLRLRGITPLISQHIIVLNISYSAYLFKNIGIPGIGDRYP